MPDDTFRTGDLVILQHATYFDEYNETPGIIVECLAGRYATNLNTMEEKWMPASYRVHVLCAGDLVVTVSPHQIRKPRSTGKENSMTEFANILKQPG